MEEGQVKKFKSENNSDNNNSDSRRVYVANVPFDVKWSELKDLFREKVGDVTYCTIFENEDGKSRGCGLLEFADSQTARKAIEIMHRSEFKSRELVVKEDLDCERDRYGRIITNHGNNRSRDDSQRRDGSNNDRGGNRDRGNRQQQQQQQQQQQNNSNNYGTIHSV
jgi:RNA recognition motif-containing protein